MRGVLNVRHMKTLFALALSLLSLNAFAGQTLENCKVSRMINESILGQSLTVEGFSTVSVEKQMNQITLNIGSNVFDNFTDAYTVLPMAHSDGWAFAYEALVNETGEAFIVRGRTIVNRKKILTKIGTVTYKNLVTGQTELLAELTCD